MKIPLANPVFDEEMKEAALDALQNERSVSGNSVHKFEEEFARYHGVRRAVSVSSGTAALQLSLIALGLKNGDEVVTTPASFVATSNAILHANGSPVFVDIDLGTYNMDPNCFEKSLTDKTRATIPVHLYGYPAEMKAINEIAQERDIFVVEDACQAHGAEYMGKKVGTLGKVGCFSFYPSKCMTVCGDGGAVVTDDEEVANLIAKLRDCGRASQYLHDRIGFTARLNTVNAAIGRVQLRRLDSWNQNRRSRAALYDKLLHEVGDVVTPPKANDHVSPVYHLYVIRTRYRDSLKDWLDKTGIQCGVHYPVPIHLQPVYRELFGFKGGEFPNSELLSQTALSLPIYPSMKDEDVKFVCEEIRAFFSMKGF